ncbi:uncharacterized protein JCM6883_006190 [Sporobolomyces salmoneus]|uniref:uncharacterized protein n=1 Tax=Sporobolomyces salmoneus TaxID=183962 RepID=UPI00316F0EFF
MYRSTLFLLLASSFLVSAAPTTSPPSTEAEIQLGESQVGIGEEAERRLWRRQLASSVNGINWTMVGGSTSSDNARPTSSDSESSTTEASSTSTEESTSSSSTESSPSSSVPLTSSSVSTTSSPTTRSSSTSDRSRSSLVSSHSSALSAASHPSSTPKLKQEAQSSGGNIFTPSNKLFAVGVIVIIAIIVLAIFIFIFIIQRILHSSRFIDPLDYPEGLPPQYSSTVISKRYRSDSNDPAQLSPISSMESYDSLEKGGMESTTTRNEFASFNGGGATVQNRGFLNPPPSAALPPLPRPSRTATLSRTPAPAPVTPAGRTPTIRAVPTPKPSSSSSATPRTPFSHSHHRAPPPSARPQEVPTSSFSAPAFDSLTQTRRTPPQITRPRPAEKPLPPTSSSSSSTAAAGSRDRPSYVSTLPLAPNTNTKPPSSPGAAVTTTTSQGARRMRTTKTRHEFSPPKGRESPLRETAFKREQTTRRAVNGEASTGPGERRRPLRRKLVIVGDGACGKTSLLSVFSLGEFPSEYEPTIFENYVAEIRLDGKPVQLALWDTAGQEEYERLRPLSYSKSHVILIAFSLDTPDSLENVSVKWIEEVRELCGPNIPVLLVGCKKDLRDQAQTASSSNGTGQGQGFVTREQGEFMAQRIGARTYKECSALLNDGVDDLFEAATRAAMLVRGTDADHGHSNSLGGGVGGGGEKGERRKSEMGRDRQGGCCSACVVC